MSDHLTLNMKKYIIQADTSEWDRKLGGALPSLTEFLTTDSSWFYVNTLKASSFLGMIAQH